MDCCSIDVSNFETLPAKCFPRYQDEEKPESYECEARRRQISARSLMAFRFSAEAYVEQAGKRGVTMWTVTAAEVLPHKEFARRWNKLCTLLKRHYPSFSAIRVFELHPGQSLPVLGTGEILTFSHGTHCHLLVDKYYDIKRFQKLAHQAGLGWVWVSCVRDTGRAHSAQSAINYLGKYLQKTFSQRSVGLFKARLWDKINFEGTRVKDVYRPSMWAVIYRRIWPAIYRESWHMRCQITDAAQVIYAMHMKGVSAVQMEEIYSCHDVAWILRWLLPSRHAFDVVEFGENGWPGAQAYFEFLCSGEYAAQRHREVMLEFELKRLKREEKKKAAAQKEKLRAEETRAREAERKRRERKRLAKTAAREAAKQAKAAKKARV